MAPHSVLLPGKPRGWKILVDYSPWGRKESDTTEQLHFLLSSLEGEGVGSGNAEPCKQRDC